MTPQTLRRRSRKTSRKLKSSMARIVVAPYGSLGDLHPHLALGIELKKRGHEVILCSLEVYQEKIELLGFEFKPLRPEIDENDREWARQAMDPKTGSETIIRSLMLTNLRATYQDLMDATEGADLLISGEIVFPSHSVAEKSGMKIITTTLAPLSMLSVYEPNIYPGAEFLRYFNFLGTTMRKLLKFGMKKTIWNWFKPYREFRKEIGLNEDHDPVFIDKYSKHLHLAMFSKTLGKPQPDWHSPTLQTGFCFYDGQEDLGAMPEELDKFLKAGDPPIVFTLGSAAVMDPRNFFEESVMAAKSLNKRAVLLYGVFNEPPKGLDEKRVGFDYAPYGRVFPRVACVVHQGGVGTTAQVLRAGVPHLIMPYSHDQPDNAARCERIGVARTVNRDRYNETSAAFELDKLLGDESYGAKAQEAKSIVDLENGTEIACDAIEELV